MDEPKYVSSFLYISCSFLHEMGVLVAIFFFFKSCIFISFIFLYACMYYNAKSRKCACTRIVRLGFYCSGQIQFFFFPLAPCYVCPYSVFFFLGLLSILVYFAVFYSLMFIPLKFGSR